jgi:hypothetical protein
VARRVALVLTPFDDAVVFEIIEWPSATRGSRA